MKFRHIVTFCFCFTLVIITTQAQARKQLADPLFSVTVPETEIIGQFHGDPINADLRIYMAGNQFVVMDLLVEEFKKLHPHIKNIFYVTIPPGKELNWILSGGIEIKAENSLGQSGFQLRVLPDVYTTVNKGHMDQLNTAGFIKKYQIYAHNRLVLMVNSNDPLAETALDPAMFYALMSDPDVVVSEPDILTQGIERHIWQMYTDVSKYLFADDPAIQALNPKMFDPTMLVNDPFNSLRRIVYHDKVLEGSTLLTEIHHLETPAFIRSGAARLGPVWVTEVMYQQNRLGKQDLALVELAGVGADGKHFDRREKVNYLAAVVKAKGDGLRNHKRAAKKWVEFLKSDVAQALLEEVGFIPATAEELAAPFVYPELEDDD